MGIENFKFKDSGNYELEDDEDEKREMRKMSRRDFLKKIGKGAGVVAVASTPIVNMNQMARWLGGEESEEIEKSNAENDELEAREEKPTVEQTELKDIEVKTIEDVLKYTEDGKIEFNLDTVAALKQEWRRQYTENPNLVNSFRKAYYEMGAWKPYLIKSFQDAGLNEEQAKKFMYLAIPESHWDPNAVSPARAVGPYQFIYSTARRFGMNTGLGKDEIQNLDERRDPEKSAFACAQHLIDVAQRADGDMQIALAGYNGSFANSYIARINRINRNKKTGEAKEKKTYEGFVAYIEERVNNVLQSVQEDKVYYRVGKGDTLGKIASKYLCSAQELQAENNIKNPKNLPIGKKLHIPIPEDRKEKVFNKVMRGYAENMVYPAKFDAIDELIDEGFVKEEAPVTRFDRVRTNEIPKVVAQHRVKSGETLYRISRRFNISVSEIKKANLMKSDTIHPNNILKIPGKHQPISLRQFAQSKNIPLTELKAINPSIVDSNIAMPINHTLRIKK